MSDEFGQKVVIENRPGVVGNIAAESVARATPDGYTLHISARSNTTHKAMYGNFNYDLAIDFIPVGLLAMAPNVIVAAKEAPIANVQDLIVLAKAYPGTLSCASTGVGSDTYLLCEIFQQETQTKLLHIPYHGGAPALVDVIGGRVDLLVFSLPGALPHIKAGSVRAVAVMSRERVPALGDIPTMAESGIRGLDAETWFGLMAPAGTPPHVIARLNQAVNGILESPELRQAFAALGYTAPPQPNTSQAFASLIASETAKWTAVIRERNIKPVQ
jgi:tripartite-type tricarboxylate transporter receptor subunit TctC